METSLELGSHGVIGHAPLLGDVTYGIALGQELADGGDERAAAMYSLIVAAQLSDIDPPAWLADALASLVDLLPRIRKPATSSNDAT